MNNEGQQALENARGEVITLSSLHNKHIVRRINQRQNKYPPVVNQVQVKI